MQKKFSAAGSATMPHSDSTTKFHAACCGRLAPIRLTAGQKLRATAASRSGANPPADASPRSEAMSSTADQAQVAAAAHDHGLMSVVCRMAER